MTVCDHQFHGGDESDWVLSTSASCLDGSSTASKILQELFKKHIRQTPDRNPRIKMKPIPEPKSEPDEADVEKPNENLIVKKISGICSFDDFDESQHLNGCPIKWLYNKKLLDKNKKYKIGKLCVKTSIKQADLKKDKCKNVRDKTPVEVKIHKINLIEKYTSNCDEVYSPYTFSSGKPEKDSKDIETRRKILAAKLNWKLHDESQDCCSKQLSETSFRQNYLPPRPLMGLKPLLSVLLAPHQESRCCCFAPQQDSSRKKKPEASLSIQSLHLSVTWPESKPQPNMTNTLRWGSKSSILAKKLQIPNQITIKLDRSQNNLNGNPDSSIKVFYSSPRVRKSNGRIKQTKSLSSLIYELKDKASYRNQDGKSFERIIRNLSMEEQGRRRRICSSCKACGRC